MHNPESYIKATRRMRKEVVATEHYQKIYDQICKIMKSNNPMPKFYATYSTARICETLNLTNEAFIIYDQYLGQTFSQLNRLHMNSKHPDVMTTYACKVLAENTQLLGHLQQSLVFAISYRSRLQDCNKSHRQDVDLRKRVITTTIQENYVIVHEAMHNIIERDPDWRLAAVRDARRDYLANRLLPIAHEVLGDKDENRLYKDSLMTQIDIFMHDDALVEECVCDTLALPVIWMMFKDLCDIATIRSAVFFALRHLRILKIISSYSDAIAYDKPDPSYINPYMIRMGFLQWTLQQFEPFRSVVSSSTTDVSFMAEQERYSKFVEDPVYYDLYHRVQSVKVDNFDDPDYSSMGKINDHVDMLIGNDDINTRIKEFGSEFFMFELEKFDPDEWIARAKKFDDY